MVYGQINNLTYTLADISLSLYLTLIQYNMPSYRYSFQIYRSNFICKDTRDHERDHEKRIRENEFSVVNKS